MAAAPFADIHAFIEHLAAKARAAQQAPPPIIGQLEQKIVFANNCILVSTYPRRCL